MANNANTCYLKLTRSTLLVCCDMLYNPQHILYVQYMLYNIAHYETYMTKSVICLKMYLVNHY